MPTTMRWRKEDARESKIHSEQNGSSNGFFELRLTLDSTRPETANKTGVESAPRGRLEGERRMLSGLTRALALVGAAPIKQITKYIHDKETRRKKEGKLE